ncbi:MAG: DUF1294 domain-containing protein [Clostridium butyricum]|nr:DUF1294 domain-containing protein [Clostridium butyricum]
MDTFIIIFLFLINLIGFILMYTDKKRAINHKWRISESTLIGIAIIGGSLGILLGMYTFRHKTKHFKFTFGVPLILIIEIVSLLFYIIKY